MLENIDIKINHIEDMVADSRAVIIKLVKQNNKIVQFLKNLTVIYMIHMKKNLVNHYRHQPI